MSKNRPRSSQSTSRFAATSELTLEESAQLKEKALSDFWNTSLVKSPSTFGVSPKNRPSYKNDNGYAEIRSCKRWTAQDEMLYTHGRIRVNTAFGKLAYNPGAGHYDPNYAAQSKTENIAPDISLTHRKKDTYFDELKQKKKEIQQKNKFMASNKDASPKKRAPQTKIKKGKFADVNIEDMRKALLPGPGSYDGNYSMIDRLPRPHSAVLAKRKNVVDPRPVLLADSLQILETPSQKLPTDQYYLRDVGKTTIAHSIGEPRPLLGQREVIAAGPGYYSVEEMRAIGGKDVLSSTGTLKKKPVDSFDSLRAAMVNTSKHGRKGLTS